MLDLEAEPGGRRKSEIQSPPLKSASSISSIVLETPPWHIWLPEHLNWTQRWLLHNWFWRPQHASCVCVWGGGSRSNNSEEMDGRDGRPLVWVPHKSPLWKNPLAFPSGSPSLSQKEWNFRFFFPCVSDEGAVLLSADPRTSPGAPERVRIT